MSHFTAASLPIRADLAAALDRGWAQLGETGAWLTGDERVAVVREARAAWDCAVCRERKAALSPYAIDGDHDAATDLPDAWIDVLHRVVTDAGRLTERWCLEVQSRGIAEDEYIELVTVATIATVIDTFALAIGLPAPDLPAALDGRPARQREPTATPGPGWVATIAPENASADFRRFLRQRFRLLHPPVAHPAAGRGAQILGGHEPALHARSAHPRARRPRPRDRPGANGIPGGARLDDAGLLLLNHQPCGAAQVERHGNGRRLRSHRRNRTAATPPCPTAAS